MWLHGTSSGWLNQTFFLLHSSFCVPPQKRQNIYLQGYIIYQPAELTMTCTFHIFKITAMHQMHLQAIGSVMMSNPIYQASLKIVHWNATILILPGATTLSKPVHQANLISLCWISNKPRWKSSSLETSVSHKQWTLFDLRQCDLSVCFSCLTAWRRGQCSLWTQFCQQQLLQLLAQKTQLWKCLKNVDWITAILDMNCQKASNAHI